MQRAFSLALTRHALLVLLLLVAATGLALTRIVDFRTGSLRLQIDTSFEQMLPSGDESRAFHDRVRKVFGNDDTLLLVLHRPGGVFEPETLAAIARLTPRIEAVPGVASVLSLANAPNIRSEGGDLSIAPLFETPPTDPAVLAALREAAFANPLYAGKRK